MGDEYGFNWRVWQRYEQSRTLASGDQPVWSRDVLVKAHTRERQP